ncbi:glycosyltransferase family 39 protein [Caldichromatium japonicum]|uniref:glycosyltransferase family 39 protein n=1 Tax=Caldichromatium japonicum TaxID=2699430 RepID=UPI001FE60DD5|nr:glycosyltransferase family 39 protein [Caldichromatium japonicum]
MIAGLSVWRLIMAALLPITQDEAYYLDWARHWSLGYFDHPPAVAWLGAGIWLAPGTVLAGRLGGLLAGILALVVLDHLYQRCGLTDRHTRALALLLTGAHLLGISGGILITPDSLLILAWALALHEAERALNTDPRRWLTAGAAIGLGLLSKYTMLLIGPVLLAALLWSDWRRNEMAGVWRGLQLLSPWPWAGALVALLIFAPNLLWNAQNGWLTIGFQLGHGFAIEVGGAVAPEVNAIDHGAYQTLAERFLSLMGYLIAQIELWGLIALLMLWVLAQRLTGRVQGARSVSPAADETPASPEVSTARILLGLAGIIPLGAFALVSWISPVEANWPGMYLIGAAPFVAQWLGVDVRWARGAALGNLALATLLVLALAQGSALPSLTDRSSRLLRETAGFAQLADYAARLDAPVYADRYQLAAMLRFYRPDLVETTQWPGLERPSEYLRGRIAPRLAPERSTGPSWLLTHSIHPPLLPGLQLQEWRVLLLCPGRGLVEVEAEPAPCRRPIQHWSLYRYAPLGMSTPSP